MLTIKQIEEAAEHESQYGKSGCIDKDSSYRSSQSYQSCHKNSTEIVLGPVTDDNNNRNDVLHKIEVKFVTTINDKGQKILKQVK